jgi:hypothetical protein
MGIKDLVPLGMYSNLIRKCFGLGWLLPYFKAPLNKGFDLWTTNMCGNTRGKACASSLFFLVFEVKNMNILDGLQPYAYSWSILLELVPAHAI